MKVRNKQKLKDQHKQGTSKYIVGNKWYSFGHIVEDPLKFANSDELRKIQNRRKKTL